MTARIGLFGGTFDPSHLGHLIIAQSLADQVRLDRVVFIPCGCPPHKKDHAVSEGRHRLAMLKLAIADNDRFETCDWELPKTEPTYTINTTAYFQQTYPDAELFWLIGADNLADLPNWYRFEDLIDQVQIVTAYRGGFDIEAVLAELGDRLTAARLQRLRGNLVRTPRIEIAACDIRRRVREGRSIRYLVPEAVESYIRQEGLYR